MRTLALDYAHLRARDTRAEALLSASIEQTGLQHPVQVVHRADGKHVLIDGYRRVRVLGRLGRDTVRVIELGACDTEALVYSHRLSTGRRRSALEDGWLLRELCEVRGCTTAEVGVLLGRSRSWVSRRLALAQSLPASIEELVRSGKVPAHGAMFCFVPFARLHKEHAEKVAASLRAARVTVTTRQLAVMWAAYRAADPEHRLRIVGAPQLFLRVAEAAEPPPTVTTVVRALDTANEALDRAYTRLVAIRAVEPGVVYAPSVKRSIARVAQACAALVAEGVTHDR